MELQHNVNATQLNLGRSRDGAPMWRGFDSALTGVIQCQFVGVSCLALRIFLQVLPFSTHQKNQHLEIIIGSG